MSASTLATPAAAPLPTAAAAAPRSRAIWLIAPALVLLGVFLLLPYLNIVLMSLRP
ncbi:MAG: ABC transporter permease, partial [Variovorax paradoxus]